MLTPEFIDHVKDGILIFAGLSVVLFCGTIFWAINVLRSFDQTMDEAEQTMDELEKSCQ